MNVKFKINATLHYWLYVEQDDFGYRIDDQIYQFTGKLEFITTQRDIYDTIIYFDCILRFYY